MKGIAIGGSVRWAALLVAVAVAAWGQAPRLWLKPGDRYWFRETTETKTSIQFPIAERSESHSVMIYGLQIEREGDDPQVVEGYLQLLWASTYEGPKDPQAANRPTDDPVLRSLVGAKFPIQLDRQGRIRRIQGVREAVRRALEAAQTRPELRSQYEAILDDEVLRFSLQWSVPLYPEEPAEEWTTEVPGSLPLVGVVRSRTTWQADGERTVRGRLCRQYRVRSEVVSGGEPKPVQMGPVTVQVGLRRWIGQGTIAADVEDGLAVLTELSHSGELELHIPGLTNPENKPLMEVSGSTRLERLEREDLRALGIPVEESTEGGSHP
ncbi:MAG: hypothetical protein KatS3mg115_1395 [Candidatus Poribacteria bacterium]|nr:MAG: hypothetical protein KatS3mg115_1395 [Candidatus Poribacteria bacterium]